MAESGADASRLEMLRERWERDPASRLFLQLAEEYRRDGQPAEAVKILETGLGHHPGYLAARVALGRCRLETGDAAGAAEALERVIAADPTQLVANKLLIATYLRLGRTAEARDRLDLYVLLNEADPEIDTLERRLMAAEDAAAPAAMPDLPTAYGELEDLARHPKGPEPAPPEERRPPAGEPLPLAPRPPAALHLEALAPPGSVRRRVDPANLPPPFPALASARPRSGAPPLAALAAAGIFRWQAAATALAVVPAAEAEEPLAPPEPAAATPLEVELEVEPEPEVETPPAPAARWWEPRVAEAPPPVEPEVEVEAESGAAAVAAPEPEPEPEPEREPEPEPEPEPPAPPAEPVLDVPEPEIAAAVEEPAARPWWQLARAEPPVAIAPPEPGPEVAVGEPWEALPSAGAESVPREVDLAAEPLGTVTPPPAAEPAPWSPGAPTWESEPSAPVPEEEGEIASSSEPVAAEATTTLGELYLQQGHLAEAEKAFAAVLARRPGDPAAEAGLAEIAERRSGPVRAADLLGSGAAPAGLTGRKIQVLQRYLQRIREGVKRDVP